MCSVHVDGAQVGGCRYILEILLQQLFVPGHFDHFKALLNVKTPGVDETKRLLLASN